MRSETSIRRSWRLGMAALALGLCAGLALGNVAVARAQSDQASEAAQSAHDEADAASEALDAATDARNQLESDGAPQEQIDAANAAVAQARANKDAADQAAEQADQAAGEAPEEAPEQGGDQGQGN